MKNNTLETLVAKEESIKREILKNGFFKMKKDDAIKFFITRFETSMV